MKFIYFTLLASLCLLFGESKGNPEREERQLGGLNPQQVLGQLNPQQALQLLQALTPQDSNGDRRKRLLGLEQLLGGLLGGKRKRDVEQADHAERRKRLLGLDKLLGGLLGGRDSDNDNEGDRRKRLLGLFGPGLLGR